MLDNCNYNCFAVFGYQIRQYFSRKKRSLFLLSVFPLLFAACFSDKSIDFGKSISNSLGVTNYEVGIEKTISNNKTYVMYNLSLYDLPDSVREIPFNELSSYTALEVVKALDVDQTNSTDSFEISINVQNERQTKRFSFASINRIRKHINVVNNFVKGKGSAIKKFVDTNYINGDYINKYLAGEKALADPIDNIYFKGFDVTTTKDKQKSISIIWLERQNGDRYLKYLFHLSDSDGKIIYYERKLL